MATLHTHNPVEALMQPKGLNRYFSDIVSVRDDVDPPVRSMRRSRKQIILATDPDEYEGRTLTDTDGKLVLAFGISGIQKISECFSDLIADKESDEAQLLAIDGIRFALVIQAAQGFTNRRIDVDLDFLERLLLATKVDKKSPIPYLRKAVSYPDGCNRPERDSALQYRVYAFAARLALNRVAAMPYSETLSNIENTGGEILASFRAQHMLELASDQFIAADDGYPLMWSAIINPVKINQVARIALPHVGMRNAPEPHAGWQSIE